VKTSTHTVVVSLIGGKEGEEVRGRERLRDKEREIQRKEETLSKIDCEINVALEHTADITYSLRTLADLI
jgi:hypothetical protein